MNTTMKHAEEFRVPDDRFVCWKSSRPRRAQSFARRLKPISMRFERRD